MFKLFFEWKSIYLFFCSTEYWSNRLRLDPMTTQCGVYLLKIIYNPYISDNSVQS